LIETNHQIWDSVFILHINPANIRKTNKKGKFNMTTLNLLSGEENNAGRCMILKSQIQLLECVQRNQSLTAFMRQVIIEKFNQN